MPQATRVAFALIFISFSVWGKKRSKYFDRIFTMTSAH